MGEKIVFNWKTTVAGVCSIVMGALALANGDASGSAAIATGLGLIFASDV